MSGVVEDCLFDNGERKGNVDLVLYTQSILPIIGFSDLGNIIYMVEVCNKIPVHQRAPYGGSLVVDACSGSHQEIAGTCSTRQDNRHKGSHACLTVGFQSMEGNSSSSISSLADALKGVGVNLDVQDYKDHAIGRDVKAASTYIECTAAGSYMKVWRVDIYEDVVQRSLIALLSAASNVSFHFHSFLLFALRPCPDIDGL